MKRNSASWFTLPAKYLAKVFPEFSEREIEVTMLYFTCLDCRAISQSLSISHKTVNTHIANAQNKLGLASYQELRSAILLRLIVSKTL